MRTCKKRNFDGSEPVASLMIKSAKIWKERRREFALLELHITFRIYRVLFPNLRSYFRNKICFYLLRIILLRNKEFNMFFLNKELSFWEIRDLETRKSVDKYLLPRIFRLNVFIHNEFSKCGRC